MTPNMMNPGAKAGARDFVKAGTSDDTPTTGPKATRYRAQKRWQERNPQKRWAHGATRSALHYGLLVKPDRCECCGTFGPVEAHHPDHRDPLRVVWLLRACHKRLHAAERRAAE